MKTQIEMLNAIIEMQEANYGNAMNTHMKLSTLVKEAKEVVKNCSIPDVVKRMRRARIVYKQRKSDEYCVMYVNVPSHIRKDRDGVFDFCSDFLEDIFGSYYSLRLDTVLNESE